MKIIIGTLVFLMSLALTGLVILFGINEMLGLHFRYWMFGFLIINFILWKIKFVSEKRFKYYLLRKFILTNKYFRKIDKKISVIYKDPVGITEEKGVKIWTLCLKSEKSHISYSTISKIRQIEKDDILIILSPLSNSDYLMEIFGKGDNSFVYEIQIGPSTFENVISLFDMENDKRMRVIESASRNTVYDQLDVILKREEESLKLEFPPKLLSKPTPPSSQIIKEGNNPISVPTHRFDND